MLWSRAKATQACSEVGDALLVCLKLSVVLGSDGLGLGMTSQRSLKAVGIFSRYVQDFPEGYFSFS